MENKRKRTGERTELRKRLTAIRERLKTIAEERKSSVPSSRRCETSLRRCGRRIKRRAADGEVHRDLLREQRDRVLLFQ